MPALPQQITFTGDVHEPYDLSAVVSFTVDGVPCLAIGSDESAQPVQILRQVSPHVYQVATDLEIMLPAADDDEIDIESLAFENGELYVIGSHSRKRKRVKPREKTAAQNRERLTKIKTEATRNQLFHLRLNPDSGKIKGEIYSSDGLAHLCGKDPYLKDFVELPSKENGIDIEALAVKDGTLYLGFRGPILRGNYVPVVVTSFDDLASYRIRFINLNGLAIRDMTAVRDGFLLIAGPMGDAPGPYGIYFWDGTDMVYGTDAPAPMPPALTRLEEIPPIYDASGAQGKAEGITVLQETEVSFLVIVVYDSLENGGAQLWHVVKG